MLARVAAIASTCLCLSACAGSRFVPLREPVSARLPRPPETIEIFASGPPATPYVDVGLIQAWGRSLPEVLDVLRREASKHTCDAVVLGPWFRMSREATCIAYLE